jgi:putative phosphoesterase
MLVVLSDTHGRDSTRLEGRTRDAVEMGSLVVHAGDYVTADVLDGFERVCELRGVSGNNDPPAVRERLPTERTFEWEALRITVTHGHEHGPTGLSMLGRQTNADLVVVGHSHDPGIGGGTVPVLNPGSHADPRWNRPAHAELVWDDDAGGARGRLVEPSGTVFERFLVEPRPTE